MTMGTLAQSLNVSLPAYSIPLLTIKIQDPSKFPEAFEI